MRGTPALLRAGLLAGVFAGLADGHLKTAANQVFFGVLAEWGGQTAEPYTTAGQVSFRVCRVVLGSGWQARTAAEETALPPSSAQLSAAQGLTKVAFQNDMQFVVSAGGNFLEEGLPGALGCPQPLLPALPILATCGDACSGPPTSPDLPRISMS